MYSARTFFSSYRLYVPARSEADSFVFKSALLSNPAGPGSTSHMEP